MKARRVISGEEKRIRDKEIKKECVKICNQFELDYDTMAIYILHHFYAMRQKLKADGIDVEAIREELMGGNK